MAVAPARFETVAIEAVTGYARNAKLHPPAQVEKISGSLAEFGWMHPIVIDERGVILAGHGRLAAAIKLRDAGTPVRNWSDGGTIPVVRHEHLTEAQKTAFRLMDNRVAEDAAWDDELLSLDLKELDAIGYDLGLTGFDEVEVGTYLGETAESDDPDHAWKGMPEFEHEDQTSFRRLLIHFKTQGDVDAFAALIGQPLTEKTRSVWYPPDEIGRYADKRYVSGEPGADDGEP